MLACRLAAIVWLCAGCTPTRDFHEIEAPSYWWSVQRELCGHTHVIDAAGAVWSEGGCETSPQQLTRRSTLEQPELEKLKRAFASLPPKGNPELAKRCTDTSHAPRVRREGQEDIVWLVCVEGGKLLESDSVPAPYRAVVQLFLDARKS